MLFEADRVELLEDIVIEVKGEKTVIGKKGDVALLNEKKITFAEKGERVKLIKGGTYRIPE